MRNPRICAILAQTVLEERHYHASEKACLIQDIVKVKKLLYGFGDLQHNEFLTDKGAVGLFDYLHELDILQLEIVRDSYGRRATELAKQRITT